MGSGAEGARPDFRQVAAISGLVVLGIGIVFMATQSQVGVFLYRYLALTSPMPPVDPNECFDAKRDIEQSHYLDSQYEQGRSGVRTPTEDASVRREQDAETCHRTRMQRKYGHISPDGHH